MMEYNAVHAVQQRRLADFAGGALRVLRLYGGHHVGKRIRPSWLITSGLSQMRIE